MNTKKIPNLFIVGAPRCGSTSTYSYLTQHPDIVMSLDKEPHFFGKDIPFKHRPSAKKYDSFFSAWKDEKVAGESSVLYLYSSEAAKEIKSFNPAAKIIILLRNPVDFLYSYHSHITSLGYEDITDFEAALDAEPARKEGKLIPRRARRLGVIKLLFYRELAAFTEQVSRYFDVFGREAVHVVILDDLKADPVGVYREMFRFLGVDPNYEFGTGAKNANMNIRSRVLMLPLIAGARLASGKSLPARAFRKLIFMPLYKWNIQEVSRPPMPEPVRKQLTEEFVPEVERLGKLLGRDLQHWSKVS